MRRFAVGVLAVAVVMLVAGPVFALPTWWNNPDGSETWVRKVGRLTYENLEGPGATSGTLSITDIPNVDIPENYKLLYLVVDWSVVPDPAENGNVGQVLLSWPDNPNPVPMTPVVGDFALGHLEFEYRIEKQPASENLFFKFSGVDLDEKLTINYELQTICYSRDGNVPEPGALVLLAGGLLGLVRRKRS